MEKITPNIRSLVLALLTSAIFTTWSRAQEVSIPDPNLNAAIHEALGKPAGPLIQLDMLSRTNLDAIFRTITSLQDLEAAQNLVALDLRQPMGEFQFGIIGPPGNHTILASSDLDAWGGLGFSTNK